MLILLCLSAKENKTKGEIFSKTKLDLHFNSLHLDSPVVGSAVQNYLMMMESFMKIMVYNKIKYADILYLLNIIEYETQESDVQGLLYMYQWCSIWARVFLSAPALLPSL